MSTSDMFRRSAEQSSGLANQRLDNVIDITNLGEESDSDATLADDDSQSRSQRPVPDRPRHRRSHQRLDQGEDLCCLSNYNHHGALLRSKKAVELADGEFLKIEAILRSRSSGEVFLKGFVFRRNSQVEDMLVKKKNELCWILHHDLLDSRSILEQSMACYNVTEVVMIRRLILTNDLFERHSYRESEERTWNRAKILERAVLVCRWKILFVPRNECFLMRLSPTECTIGYSALPAALRETFRGATDIEEPSRNASSSNSSSNNGYSPTASFQQPRYTFADAFCGAGGASRAAQQANFAITWAFDSDQAAIDSYCLNFPAKFTDSRREDVYAHLTSTDNTSQKVKVDVLHISTPCQPLSPNHTRPGVNDETNEAVFLSVSDILKRARPRVVTLEQTLGLGFPQKRLWLRALIHMFTSLAFSVRWRTFDLREFGLPQPRKRFILFAACPGEPLPDFPKPTHYDPEKSLVNPGLAPFKSVNNAISSIPPGTTWHNPQDVSLQHRGQTYDGNAPLTSTICCGNSLVHPSGTRKMTLRELACLQGVPIEHNFAGNYNGDKTRVQRQIGNMVPPSAFEPFLSSIHTALQRLDQTPTTALEIADTA